VAAPYEVHPNQISSWEGQVLEKAVQIFGGVAADSSADREQFASCTRRRDSSRWRGIF